MRKEFYSKVLRTRRDCGFSLVTVLTTGLIGSMFVAAAYSMLVPLLQQSSIGKQNLVMRTLAESAADYVAYDIVAGLKAGQPSNYDDIEAGPPYTNVELNAAQLGIADSTNSNVRLYVTVKNSSPPILPNSAYNDIQSVASDGQNTKKKWSLIKSTQGGWRIIEIKAISGSTKLAYRATLRPMFGDNSPPDGLGSSSQTYFPQNVAAFGTTNLSILSNTEVNGNLATNGSPLSINGRSITVNGDVKVNSLDFKSDDVVASGNSSDSSAKINGFVDVNGKTTGFTTSNAENDVQINRPSNGASNYDPDPSRPLITEGGSVDQTGVAPAPQAPSDAVDLGAVHLSGDAKLVISEGPASIPPGQSLSNLQSGTATIPPGNYKISSLSVSDSASISVGSSSNLPAPASFFVDSAGSGDTAVSVNGQGVTQQGSSIPGNFQIWYNGTRTVNIGAANSSMSVYAPNAKIVVNGGKGTAQFRGALLGNSVSVSNAVLTFQTPTATVNNARNSGQPSVNLYDDGTGKLSLKTHGLKRVLWQELTYSEWIGQGNPAF